MADADSPDDDGTYPSPFFFPEVDIKTGRHKGFSPAILVRFYLHDRSVENPQDTGRDEDKTAQESP